MSETTRIVNTPTQPANRKHEFEASKTKPIALTPIVANIPEELRDLKQWVVWDYVWNEKKEKWGKPLKNPRCPTSRAYHKTKKTANNKPFRLDSATSTDPETWCVFNDPLFRLRYERQGWGIGLVFTADGIYAGMDLDNCRDPITGKVEPWALLLVEKFATYTEISASGTGVHCVFKARFNSRGRKLKDADGHEIELYDRTRYFVFTGHTIGGTTAIADCQAQVDEIFADDAARNPPAVPPAIAPRRPAHSLNLSDAELIEKASSANDGGKFLDLWTGGLGGNPSESEADLALCNELAFYTGDEGRIDDLFRQSGRYRKKWERADYREATIAKSMAGRTEFYDPERHNKPTPGQAAIDRYLSASDPLPETPATDRAPDPVGNPWIAELGRALGDDGGSITADLAPTPLPPQPPVPLHKQRCPHCFKKLRRDKQNGMLGFWTFSCRALSCEVCSERYKLHYLESARVRMAQHAHLESPPPLFILFLSRSQWDRLWLKIKRSGANHLRIDPAGDGKSFLLVTTYRVLPEDGLGEPQEITPQSASDRLEFTIRNIPGPMGRKCYFGGHGPDSWKLLATPKKKDTQWVDVGRYDATEEQEDAILDHYGAEARTTQSTGGYHPWRARIFKQLATMDADHLWWELTEGSPQPRAAPSPTAEEWAEELSDSERGFKCRAPSTS
jgi:putative DNA primase/helicase